MPLNSLTEISWHESCLDMGSSWVGHLGFPGEQRIYGVEKMTDETKVEEVQSNQGRRKFLKTAAQVAITAPAAVILLNATTVRAQTAPYGAHLADGLVNTPDNTTDLGKCTGSGYLPNDQFVNNPLDCAGVGQPK